MSQKIFMLFPEPVIVDPELVVECSTGDQGRKHPVVWKRMTPTCYVADTIWSTHCVTRATLPHLRRLNADVGVAFAENVTY